MSAILEARNVRKVYRGGDDLPVTVLTDVNLSVRRGEAVAIVGASGAGKSTLLHLLGALDTPTGGEIVLDGVSYAALTDEARDQLRNKRVGFVFQFHHLLPEFTALENVMIPGMIRGQDKHELSRRAETLLDQVNLSHRLHHRSGELSGGEQQRVALARALIMNPSLLLADEPTGNLDSKSGQMVFDLLRNMSRERNLSVVMVTHNQVLAKAMDRCLTLKDGVLNGD